MVVVLSKMFKHVMNILASRKLYSWIVILSIMFKHLLNELVPHNHNHNHNHVRKKTVDNIITVVMEHMSADTG